MISEFALRNFERFIGHPTGGGGRVNPLGAYDQMPKALRRFRGAIPLKQFERGGAFDVSPDAEKLTELMMHLQGKMPDDDCDQAKELVEHLLNVQALGDDDEPDASQAADSRATAPKAHAVRRPTEREHESFAARYPDAVRIKVHL